MLAAVTERACGSNDFSCSQDMPCSDQEPFLFRSGRKRNGSWTPKRKAGRGGVPCTPRYRWERDTFYRRPEPWAGLYPGVLLYNPLRHRPHIPTLARPAMDVCSFAVLAIASCLSRAQGRRHGASPPNRNKNTTRSSPHCHGNPYSRRPTHTVQIRRGQGGADYHTSVRAGSL